MKTNLETNGNRVAFYGRYSSKGQNPVSIQIQRKASLKLANEKNLVVVDEYYDYAKTGTDMNRPELQRLLTDCNNNKFDHVIIYQIDRLARNNAVYHLIKGILYNNNVTLLSIIDKIGTTPEEKLLENFQASMAQYYSENQARLSLNGLLKVAEMGLHTGGTPLLGFRKNKETKKLEIDPDEAFIVRKIFSMYANYSSYDEIVTELNLLGLKSKRYKEFNKSSINSILRNERYRGVYLYNEHQERDQNRKRTQTKKQPNEVVRIEGGLPQIIDDETFFKVAGIIDSHKNKGGRSNAINHYLLSGGIIICGECGATLSGNSRRSGERRSQYNSYRCNRKHSKKQCTCREIKKEHVESFVIDSLNYYLSSTELVSQLAETLNKDIYLKLDEKKKNVKQLQNHLNDVNRRIDNLVHLVADGTLDKESVRPTLDKYNENKANLEATIQDANSNQTIHTFTEHYVLKLLDEVKDYIINNDTAEGRKFIHNYIKSVLVFNDRIEVIFNITSEGELNEEHTLKCSITREELKVKYAS